MHVRRHAVCCGNRESGCDNISRPVELLGHQLSAPADMRTPTHKDPPFRAIPSPPCDHRIELAPTPALPLLQQLVPSFPNTPQELGLLQEPTAVLLSIRSELLCKRGVARGVGGPVVCGLSTREVRTISRKRRWGKGRQSRTFSIVVIFLPFVAATREAFIDSRLWRGLRRRGALLGLAGADDADGVAAVDSAGGADGVDDAVEGSTIGGVPELASLSTFKSDGAPAEPYFLTSG
jgi:hypothetical protein